VPRNPDSFRNMIRTTLRRFTPTTQPLTAASNVAGAEHATLLLLCPEQGALTVTGLPTEQPFTAQRRAQ
jgi:hypothetical protein